MTSSMSYLLNRQWIMRKTSVLDRHFVMNIHSAMAEKALNTRCRHSVPARHWMCLVAFKDMFLQWMSITFRLQYWTGRTLVISWTVHVAVRRYRFCGLVWYCVPDMHGQEVRYSLLTRRWWYNGREVTPSKRSIIKDMRQRVLDHSMGDGETAATWLPITVKNRVSSFYFSQGLILAL